MIPTLDEKVLDKLRALGDAAGDPGILDEVVEAFLEHVPERLHEIDRAAQRNDVSTVGLHAHGLKGTASTIGARAFGEAAARLETLTQRGTLSEAEGLITALHDEFRHLQPALEALAKGA